MDSHELHHDTAERIRATETMLRAVIDHFPALVFWKNRHSVYLGCNPAYAVAAGLADPREIVGKTDHDLSWGPTHGDSYIRDDRDALASGCSKLGIIESQVQANGRLAWFETNKVVLRDASGTIIGLLGVARDITDRRETETALARHRDDLEALVRERTEALRLNEERLNLVIKGSNDAPWDWDLVNNRLYYSPRWWQMIGYATDELPADAALWQKIMHPDDAAEVGRVFGGAIQHGPDAYEVEFRLRHKAGHWVPVRSRGFIVRDASGKALRVAGTNTDLTAQKRTEAELERRKEAAEAANRAKSVFLANMSH